MNRWAIFVRPLRGLKPVNSAYSVDSFEAGGGLNLVQIQ